MFPSTLSWKRELGGAVGYSHCLSGLNKDEKRPGIYSSTTHKTFGLKIYAALEVNSWYMFVQIKYTWRLVGINAAGCAPINLYL